LTVAAAVGISVTGGLAAPILHDCVTMRTATFAVMSTSKTE
jgi:hypothetical protein